MPLHIGIFGRGRLGAAIAAVAERADDLAVAWQVGREAALDLSPVDVALEVSHSDAVADHLAWAWKNGTALVIGTTGWDPGLLRTDPTGARADGAAAAKPPIGILTAPNFSLSVALMRRFALALGGYARLHDADLAVSEVHHSRKADSPSGTAVLLRAALAEGSGRPATTVQTTSLRLGAVVGQHELRYETPAESLALRHEAHSRDVFALGALTAARWINGRHGIFTFDDLAAEVIDPLFQTTTEKEEP